MHSLLGTLCALRRNNQLKEQPSITESLLCNYATWNVNPFNHLVNLSFSSTLTCGWGETLQIVDAPKVTQELAVCGGSTATLRCVFHFWAQFLSWGSIIVVQSSEPWSCKVNVEWLPASHIFRNVLYRLSIFCISDCFTRLVYSLQNPKKCYCYMSYSPCSLNHGAGRRELFCPFQYTDVAQEKTFNTKMILKSYLTNT